MDEIGLVATVYPQGYRPQIDKLLSKQFSVPVDSSRDDIIEIAERHADSGQRLCRISTQASCGSLLLWENDANDGEWAPGANKAFGLAKKWGRR